MKRAMRTIAVTLTLLLPGCAGISTAPTQEEARTLAPMGKLRVGLYLGGPPNVVRDAASGEMKGVGYDLGKELAMRLGVPFEPIVYPTVGGVVDGAKSGEWDVACLTDIPERGPIMDFTAPFIAIEHGYLVAASSTMRTVADVDHPGIRVGVPKNGALEPILMRNIKNAQVVPGPGLAGVLEMLKSGKVDAFAANKANLFEMSDRLPGSRVLDGRIAVDHISIAVVKGRRSAIPFLETFVADARSKGLIKAASARAALRGAVDE